MKAKIKIFFAILALLLGIYSAVCAQNMGIRTVTGTPTAGTYTPGTRDSKTVYSTTNNKLYTWNGTGWTEMPSSGTFTPTLVISGGAFSNLTVQGQPFYSRTDKVVTLYMAVNVTFAVGNTSGGFTFAPPISSAFTNTYDVMGLVVNTQATSGFVSNWYAFRQGTDIKVQATYDNYTSNTAHICHFIISYIIK